MGAMLVRMTGKAKKAGLRLALENFAAGERVAVAVSGGADSVALLRALLEVGEERGLVLSVAHFHHGLRNAADDDAKFVEELAGKYGLVFRLGQGDTGARAKREHETVEEAARALRYGFFDALLGSDVDVVASAHTLDDQAETVVMKWLRGAWTEGLGGIAPVVMRERGRIVRPLLAVRRSEVEGYLRGLGQEWREDDSNRDVKFMRNRVRHELMPVLRGFNENVDEQMARLAEIARGEEAHWEAETEKLLREILLTGRAVRGGGRSMSGVTGQAVAMDLSRWRSFDEATRRRVLRAAARRAGQVVDFAGTEQLMALADGRVGAKAVLTGGLRAERTARELRMECGAGEKESVPAEVICAVPGETVAVEFGVRVKLSVAAGSDLGSGSGAAVLRVWKAGDRVRLRYTLREQKVKEVLGRIKATASERAVWPVLEWRGRIVWMRGAEVERMQGGGEPELAVTALDSAER
jgi:tRNA(Ile)-lysidine synthase